MSNYTKELASNKTIFTFGGLMLGGLVATIGVVPVVGSIGVATYNSFTGEHITGDQFVENVGGVPGLFLMGYVLAGIAGWLASRK